MYGKSWSCCAERHLPEWRPVIYVCTHRVRLVKSCCVSFLSIDPSKVLVIVYLTCPQDVYRPKKIQLCELMHKLTVTCPSNMSLYKPVHVRIILLMVVLCVNCVSSVDIVSLSKLNTFTKGLQSPIFTMPKGCCHPYKGLCL